MSDTSGKSLIEFWTWASDKGQMNQNTAGGMRAAVSKVLSVEDSPDEVDVTKLDVESILKRFENLKKKEFTPGSLETYKSRFRQAVKSYLSYVENPGGWKWSSRERSSGAEHNGNGAQPKRNRSATTTTEAPEAPPQPQGKTMDFPFPLREGVIAHLWLPTDLRAIEVKRLTAFMTTLVGDEATA